MVQPGRPLMTIIWRMRTACWMTKATDTHSEYVKTFCFSTATMVTRMRLYVTLMRTFPLTFFTSPAPNFTDSYLPHCKCPACAHCLYNQYIRCCNRQQVTLCTALLTLHHSVSLPLSRSSQLSWDVSADAGSLRDKAVVVGAAIKENTLTRFVITYSHDKLKLKYRYCRPQWPRGLKRRSGAARLLRFWVRILPGAWMSVSCECCVLSGRGLWMG